METKTKPTQNQRIIQALRRAGALGITSTDMIGMRIYKYSSRIAELRQDGYNIVATREKGTLWRYNLIPERSFENE